MRGRRVMLLGVSGLLGVAGVLVLGLWLVAAQTAVLYDGQLGGLPDSQSLLYRTYSGNFPVPSQATQREQMGYTLLDTTAVLADYAGYGAAPVQVAAMPVLSRSAGFTLTFGLQISDEMHTNEHRAGFSVLALSSDNRGVELGFWEDRIWAQEGNGARLFTQAEGVAFDTTAVFVTYSLNIQGESYRLLADEAVILTGTVRSYTDWEPPLPGVVDPYEVPSAIFLGDNSTTSKAASRLAFVGVTVGSQPPVAEGERLFLPFVVRGK